MNIGEAAAAAQVSAKMIRHYESIGLLPKAPRTGSNYRVYGESDIHILRFIRRARSLGFSINDIRALLELWVRKRPSREVKRLVKQHTDDLRERIAGMEAMVSALTNLADHCHGDDRPDCPILEDLRGSA